MSLVFRDAFWQIFWRLISAIAGFFVIKLVTPYLWPLRYWDYSTVLKYFAIWSALADFGIYVIALNSLGKIKDNTAKLLKYHKFLWFRFFMVFVVYATAFCIAYFIPSYTQNIFIYHGLVIWMMFSAIFMLAWIVQIPLQLNWKMKHVSIALIIARIIQIIWLIIIIYLIFPNVNFHIQSSQSLIAFLAVLVTVLLSWISQFLYVLFVWNKYMKFKVNFDFSFIKLNIKQNWRYWVSYFLSSFHTLIVLIFLSILFPTSKWFIYVWIWSVALALIEILLIVPSAFWNSIIHKISSYDKITKLKSLWYYLIFIIWVWFLVMFNFFIFKTQIINFVAWSKYLTNPNNIWSDSILPFLSIVLFLSFIKQVFNYILVSFNKQNTLFFVNLLWVIIWIISWLLLISKFNLYWWIVTQLLLEFCFVIWAIFVAKYYNILPILNIKLLIKNFLLNIFYILLVLFLFNIFNIYMFLNDSKIYFILVAMIVNTIYLIFSYKFIKNTVDNI